MLGLYVHRRSPVHRARAEVKLAALASTGIAVFLTTDPVRLGVGLAAVCGLAALARLPARGLLAQLRPAVPLVVTILLVHGALTGWDEGLVAVLRLAILALGATLVTLTTRVSDMIEAMERAMRPLSAVGVSPAKVSLMLSMTIRFIPLLADQAREILEARRARGATRGVALMIVPLLIRTLRMAGDLTDAIEARGYDAD